MFKVVVNDGQAEMPTDDVFYVIAKEGIFLKKTIGVMDSVAPVNQISTLQSVAASARMRISKIPGPKFAKVIEFFREVYKQYYAEAIVLLFYDEEKQIHTIIPPEQKVSGGSCEYNRGITIEGLTMIGTIHSHGGMSAFHSGVDDKDEESFDGLHITIGNMRDEEVSISTSIVANGYRVMVDINDYVEQLSLTKDVDEKEEKATTTVYRYVAGKLVKDEKQTSRYSYTQRKYDKRYVATVTDHQKTFNKRWMKMVKKGTYNRTSYYNRGEAAAYGYGSGIGWPNQGWGQNYDSHAWADRQPWRRNQNLPSTIVKSPLGGLQKTQGAGVPSQGADEEVNQCENCTFRDDKIDWAIQQYTEEVDGPDEENVTNNFILDDKHDHMFQKNIPVNIVCVKCSLKYNLVMTTTCPGCGEVAPDEIDMKNVDSTPIEVDPVFGRDFVCPTCGNTFTHKGLDACPFCEEELDFEEHRKVDSRAISDEEIEDGSGNLIPGDVYICKACSIIFTPEENIAACPECCEIMIDGDNCKPFKTDETLHGHGDEFDKVAIAAAAEEDKGLEQPLPDPEKSEIPIPTITPEDVHARSLKSMFKRVFGSGGKS